MTVAGNKLIADNRSIAEFMGCKVDDDGFPYLDVELENGVVKMYPYGDLRYHTSWDALMPVVEKIEGLGSNDEERYNVLIELDIAEITVYVDGEITKQFECMGATKIDAVYQAVIQFIEWYNQQQKQP